MRKIKSSYNYGRTGKHGLKRRSKSNINGAFGKPRKKRKVCKRCGIRLSYEEERSGFDLCELCRDQNLKDGKRKYFLGRLTCAKDRLFMSWKVQEKDSLQTEDSLSLATVRKYGLLSFSKKDTIKDLRKGIAEYFRKNNVKSRDAFVQYFKQYIYNTRGLELDWACEIVGKVR